jgi:hypothetical protein
MAAGRLNDAVKAYDAALDIRDDPLVSGRLGLALMMWEDPKLWVSAARLLQHAVSETAGVSSAERRQIFEAYERVRRHVCRLEVLANDVKTEVDVGDGHMKPSKGAFWVFVAPGTHELTARLKDREDIRRPYECANGATITIHVDFPAPPEPKLRTITVEQPGRERTVVVRERAPVKTTPAVQLSTMRRRLSAAVGSTMVINTAPSPAFGASLSGAYRIGSFSGMVGARGAWSVGSVGPRPFSSFAFTGFGGPCAHWRWFDACALASVNVIDYRMNDSPVYFGETNGAVIPGFGIGLGAQYGIGGPLALRLSGDLSALTRHTSISIASSAGKFQIWEGGRFLASVTLALVITE